MRVIPQVLAGAWDSRQQDRPRHPHVRPHVEVDGRQPDFRRAAHRDRRSRCPRTQHQRTGSAVLRRDVLEADRARGGTAATSRRPVQEVRQLRLSVLQRRNRSRGDLGGLRGPGHRRQQGHLRQVQGPRRRGDRRSVPGRFPRRLHRRQVSPHPSS